MSCILIPRITPLAHPFLHLQVTGMSRNQGNGGVPQQLSEQEHEILRRTAFVKVNPEVTQEVIAAFFECLAG